MFVRYPCGCIGMRVANRKNPGAPERNICIKPCDDDSNYDISHDITFFYRGELDRFSGNQLEPLSQEEQDELVGTIGLLIADGHRMQTIRTWLR